VLASGAETGPRGERQTAHTNPRRRADSSDLGVPKTGCSRRNMLKPIVSSFRDRRPRSFRNAAGLPRRARGPERRIQVLVTAPWRPGDR